MRIPQKQLSLPPARISQPLKDLRLPPLADVFYWPRTSHQAPPSSDITEPDLRCLILSRVDDKCCNSLLHQLSCFPPKTSEDTKQSLVIRGDVDPNDILKMLRWIPVADRTKFKKSFASKQGFQHWIIAVISTAFSLEESAINIPIPSNKFQVKSFKIWNDNDI